MALDHYISQVHLKRFYSPALNNLMHAIRKSDFKKFTPKAKDVCRLDEGSTNDYLTDPRAIEEFLKAVEGGYNSAVFALEAGKPDREAIYVAAGFLAYVLTCSPAAMRINTVPILGTLETVTKLAGKKGLFPQPPPELGGKSFAELLGSGDIKFEVDPKYPQAVGISNILQRVATFGNSDWECLINHHQDCPFFTSDFPVGIETTSDKRVLNRIFPLSPTLAIRIRPDINFPRDSANFEFRNFSFQRRNVTRREAIGINRLIVQAAEDMVFYRGNQLWVEGFVEKNRHFRIDGENIQIAQPQGHIQWSRQAIMPFKRGNP
jgi:Protein of unknown function (DUF4238)